MDTKEGNGHLGDYEFLWDSEFYFSIYEFQNCFLIQTPSSSPPRRPPSSIHSLVHPANTAYAKRSPAMRTHYNLMFELEEAFF